MRFFFFLSFFLLLKVAFGQAEISSSNGWTATIEVTPVDAVPQSSDCPWYYNYEVEFDYKVTFSGTESNRNFSANIYFQCQGGSGGEPYVSIGNLSENKMGTKATVNSARQYNSVGGAYDYGNKPDCQELNVHDIGCSMVRMDYWGNGVPNGSITFNTGSGPLPIELYDFSADVKDYGIVLKWTTLSELNNDFFLIERSTNAEDWQIIKTIGGSGTTARTSDYSIIDSEQEGTTYYRLTQVDFDGKREAFDPIAVTPQNHRKMEEPYPNPVDDFLFIPGLGDGKALQIVDIYGKTINENLYRRQGESVNVRNLPEGIYLIDIAGDNNAGAFKVVVKH